jgi:hypothetical protein
LAILGLGITALGGLSVFVVAGPPTPQYTTPPTLVAHAAQQEPAGDLGLVSYRRFGDQPVSTYVTPADVLYSPDGSQMTGTFYKGNQGWVISWDRRSGRRMWEVSEPNGRTFTGAYLSSGKRLLTASLDDTLVLWNLETRAPTPLSRWPTPPRPGVQFWLWNVKVSPDGRTVAAPALPPAADAYANGISLWDAASRRSRGELIGPDSKWATGFAFSPDGHYLLGAVADGCCLWDLATLKIMQRFENTAGARAGAFAPDGRSVAVAGEFDFPKAGPREWQRVKFIDLASGQMRHGKYIDYNNEGEKAVAYSPDGRVVATIAMRDPRIRLWDPATGAELAALDYRSPGTFSGGIAFAPHGVRLATTTSEGQVLEWDLTQMSFWKKLVATPLPNATAPAAADEQPALSEIELNRLWDDLAGTDGAKAYRATWTLALHHHDALPLLRERLRPARAPADGEVARLLVGLDDADYPTRQRCSAALAQFARQIVPDLRAAKESTKSAEVGRRLSEILEGLDSGFVADPETLRALHAVEALEHIARPEAIALLREMAKGVPEASETQEAAFALQRLTGN